MRFHARVGILPHERELPQPLEVDLTVRLAAPSKRGKDAARAIVDYRSLYDRVASLIDSQPLLYLEEIADGIARAALEVPGVAAARVAVRKPHVPLPGPLAYAEIVVEREGR